MNVFFPHGGESRIRGQRVKVKGKRFNGNLKDNFLHTKGGRQRGDSVRMRGWEKRRKQSNKNKGEIRVR